MKVIIIKQNGIISEVKDFDSIDRDEYYSPKSSCVLDELQFLINIVPVKDRIPFNKQIKETL